MKAWHTVEQQTTFEHLAGAVSLRGWKDFEVTLDSDELRIERHGGRAACTVIMVPHEPTLQAHFAFAPSSVHAVTFTIGESATGDTATTNTESFRDTDAAAQWLVEFLESGARS